MGQHETRRPLDHSRSRNQHSSQARIIDVPSDGPLEPWLPTLLESLGKTTFTVPVVPPPILVPPCWVEERSRAWSTVIAGRVWCGDTEASWPFSTNGREVRCGSIPAGSRSVVGCSLRKETSPPPTRGNRRAGAVEAVKVVMICLRRR